MLAFIFAHKLLFELGAAGFIGSVVASSLRDIGAFALGVLKTLLFEEIKYGSEGTNQELLSYFYRNSRVRIPFGTKSVSPMRVMISQQLTDVTAHELTSGDMFFLFEGRPLFFKKPGESGRGDVPDTIVGSFIFFRFTFDWGKLVRRIGLETKELIEKADSAAGTSKNVMFVRCNVDKHGSIIPNNKLLTRAMGPAKFKRLNINNGQVWMGASEEEVDIDPTSDPFSNIELSPGMVRIERELEFFIDHEEWHKKRGVPWNYGALLYGPPGTGKTSLVRAVSQRFGLTVLTVDLAAIDNQGFRSVIEYADSFPSPHIILLEDFDAVFHGRENQVPGSELTFDTILNAIDGLAPSHGRILLITTNHLKHIDPALGQVREDGTATRPGRIDSIVEIGAIDFEAKVRLGIRITLDDTAARKLALDNPDDTPAQFMGRCQAFARAQLWEDYRSSRETTPS